MWIKYVMIFRSTLGDVLLQLHEPTHWSRELLSLVYCSLLSLKVSKPINLVLASRASPGAPLHAKVGTIITIVLPNVFQLVWGWKLTLPHNRGVQV